MKRIILLITLLQNTCCFAQIASGLFEDNYTGSTGMLINPAQQLIDPDKWEVNVVSTAVFFDNNYIYYNYQTVGSLVKYIQSDFHNGQNFSFFNQSSLHLNCVGLIQGPSFYIHDNNSSFGVFTDERVGASIESYSSPQNLNNLFTVPYNQIIKIPTLHGAYMNWAEVGVSAATMLKDNETKKFYLGADIKITEGLTAGKYDNNIPFEFERHNDSTVNTTPVNMDYSYAQSASGSSPISNLFAFNGGGVGTDIGFLYTLGEKISCNQLYSWKFGGSINDVGVITFKRRSFDFQLTQPNENSFPDTAFVHTTTITDLNEALSNVTYNDTISSHSGNTFYIWLPTSVTLVVDKSLGNGFYIEASLIRRVAITYDMIYSPNMESITPRYENKWITVAVPLVLYNESDFHFGLSVRLGPLTIGSDDLYSLIIPGKMAGTDIYVGLRISPFKSDCASPKNANKNNKLDACPPISQ